MRMVTRWPNGEKKSLSLFFFLGECSLSRKVQCQEANDFSLMKLELKGGGGESRPTLHV